jgi:signal transduction histidine kinase
LTSVDLPAPRPSTQEFDGLAHDAGNLLNALRLYSDLLSAPGVLRPEHRHYADELSQLSERSTQLIDRMFAAYFPPSTVDAASRTEGPALAQSLRHLAPLLDRIASPHANVSVQAALTADFESPSSEQLERIVLNLVCNASEAIAKERRADPARRRGRIQVRLSQVEAQPDAGPKIRLQVEDDGPGLRLSTASAFLHPSATPVSARHGHGHRIVHDLVRDSGATLAIHIRRGQGTLFTIDWPLFSTAASSQYQLRPSQPSLKKQDNHV